MTCIEHTSILLLQLAVQPGKVSESAYDFILLLLVLFKCGSRLHLVGHICLQAPPLSMANKVSVAAAFFSSCKKVYEEKHMQS